MKKVFLPILIFIIIIASVYFFIKRSVPKNNISENPSGNTQSEINFESGSKTSSTPAVINGDNLKNINMNLTSLVFENNQYIPAKYTCDGANINPPLSIAGIPEKTKSMVLIVDDPDAPKGDWVHWIVFNIPPDTKEIKENSLVPNGIQGRTDFKNPGYGGPCPPSGIHHYQFKLYALDTMLDLDISAHKKEIEKAMNGHILAQDLLVGLYKKK